MLFFNSIKFLYGSKTDVGTPSNKPEVNHPSRRQIAKSAIVIEFPTNQSDSLFLFQSNDGKIQSISMVLTNQGY